MADWKNLDQLDAYQELVSDSTRVDLREALAGEQGAQRVKRCTVPMACGLSYNYGAKQVDDALLEKLARLAEEAQLAEKFAELYNGAMINTGEKRLVLHHLTRGQLGEPVMADGVDKREFYVEQQKRIDRLERLLFFSCL